MLLEGQFVVVTQTIQPASLLLMILRRDVGFITYTENLLSAALKMWVDCQLLESIKWHKCIPLNFLLDPQFHALKTWMSCLVAQRHLRDPLFKSSPALSCEECNAPVDLLDHPQQSRSFSTALWGSPNPV